MREASRTCNYCGSPIATVRCWRCLMMNVPEAMHCMGCGAELGIVPFHDEQSSDWPCPQCRAHHLDAFSCDDGTFFDCARCGGQFVPHVVLQSLVQRHQRVACVQNSRLRPNNPLQERVAYRPCPSCRELMHRRNFGLVSGIIVDVCSVHGSWFDVGELARILAFVGQGGIESGQVAKAQMERIRAAPIHSHGGRGPSVGGLSFSDDTLTWEDMREAGLAFARWIQDAFRR